MRSLPLRLVALGLLLTGAAAQEPARLDQELVLSAGAPLLDGHGRCVSVSYRTVAAGGIFVWAESDAFDPYLHVESADGSLRLENDNDGGGTTAWVRTPIQAGVELKIQIAGQAESAAGKVRLRIREMPESEASQVAKLNLEAAFTESKQLAREGNLLDARGRLEPAVAALLAAPGVECNADAHGTLWRVTQVLPGWGGDVMTRKIFEGLASFGPDRYPPLSRAVLQMQGSLCGMLAQNELGDEAMPWCERALAIAERSFGVNSLEAATSRFNLGLALLSKDELEAARDLMQSAVDDYVRLLGDDDMTTAQGRMSLGTVLCALGELDEARRQEEHAVEVMSKIVEPTHYLLLGAQGNLAATLDALGDDRAARAVHQEVLSVYSRLYEPEHVEVLRARHNVAICLLRSNELQAAAAEFEALGETYRRLQLSATLDAESAELALGDTYNKQGRHAEALSVVESRRGLPGRKASAGDWRLCSIASDSLLGEGKLDGALAQAEAALSAASRALPPDNPDLASVRQAAASLNMKLGKQERAFELTCQAVADARAYFASCATTLSMSQAEAAQAHWSRLVSDGIALLDATASKQQRAKADTLAFELSESARGIGTELLRCTQASSSPGVEGLRRQVRAAAREVARVGAGAHDATALEVAIASKERSERDLRDALSGLVGAQVATARPTAEDARKSIPHDGALIAYWRIDTRPIDAPPAHPREARLCAFVLRADGPVRKFDLGPLAPIDTAVQAWRASMLSSGGQAAEHEVEIGMQLRRLILDPLFETIGPAVEWRVALDDVLNLIAPDALPLQGGRIGDGVRLCVAPTALSAPRAGDRLGRSGGLLVLGGVDYDFAPEQGSAGHMARADSKSPDLRVLRTEALPKEFEPLWETLDEVDGLAALYAATREAPEEDPYLDSDWDRQEPVGPVAKLCDRDATKRALEQAVSHASLIHIATHGFFSGDGPKPSGATETVLAERSPLALCGLALTGANAGPDELGFEGVITAEELATLDLSGCRLVVLSACDTNVGTLSAGQGVASFQKALHAAGAKVVVTSLWKVDDSTTRELMLEFYRGMWVGKLSPEDALWRAKAQRIARRAPVRDWAGWVLSGQ